MSDTQQDELSRNLVFDILSNPRRRYMLYYLSRREEPVHIQDLSAQVAAWENDIPVEEVGTQQRKRVYVSFYQTHIPKLEEVGVVRYDQDEGTVELTDRAMEIERHLGDGEEEEAAVPWQLAYLALAIASSVFFLLVAGGVPGFAALPTTVAGAVIVLAFAALAGYHYLRTRAPEAGKRLRRLEDEE